MRLDRTRLLAEMGLSPEWVLRERPAAASALEIEAKPVANAMQTPTPPGPKAPPAAPPVSEVLPAQTASLETAGPAAPDWPVLLETIAACRRCGLCEKRKQTVPGIGDINARWMLIGEGPGTEEDARGEPFVGQAGRLLDAMLAAVDLKRGENVYITNAVKCRPPNNRTPEAQELAACWPYLKRQIELVSPRLIVLFGRTAVQAVLKHEGSLAGMRGKTHRYREGEMDIPVIVTYHPAYLLRNLPDKAKAWEDLCRARAAMRE